MAITISEYINEVEDAKTQRALQALHEAVFTKIETWQKRYPEISEKFKDSDGCHPKHTFFYPIEEYRRECMESLSSLCHKGYGEVEVHLHHKLVQYM